MQHAPVLGKGLNSKGVGSWLGLSPGSPAPLSCTSAFLERITLRCNETIKSTERAGNARHRHSQRLRNASTCHPWVTQLVVPAVSVSLGAPGAAGSKFHFSVVGMSSALPGLAVFNGNLNMNYTLPIHQPGQVLKGASC